MFFLFLLPALSGATWIDFGGVLEGLGDFEKVLERFWDAKNKHSGEWF